MPRLPKRSSQQFPSLAVTLTKLQPPSYPLASPAHSKQNKLASVTDKVILRYSNESDYKAYSTELNADSKATLVMKASDTSLKPRRAQQSTQKSVLSLPQKQKLLKITHSGASFPEPKLAHY
ncbi:hypothetical protein KC19_4G254800 [Ceratodon purpureus]|uniref:Uncharacterized protein n=1 Tax=Ceratodon purpureus TaxID=3225 RepID=A0A8T0IDI3_CERPU|nr:hypothetical protein KC19_4G254800 [Ceratodon purpureus]